MKVFFILLLSIPLVVGGNLYADETIAEGELKVKGLSLSVEPIEQTVPVNTPTAVETIFTVDTPQLLKGMVVKGEVKGPGLNSPITLTTLPNHPFSIPGLSLKGDYWLENIRLERDGEVLLKADPDNVLIKAMDIVVTRIETRPLKLEEIREKGINITDENFTVYNFSVGIAVGSEEVHYNFPVVYSENKPPYIPSTGGSEGSGGGIGIGGFSSKKVPFQLEPINVQAPIQGGEGELEGIQGSKITGVLIFNNDIAFLNQFFSVMFIVSNNAPEGSNLSLKDLTAKITFPDGLREAKTTPPHVKGTPIPVRCPGPDGKIGTSDDLDIILATFSGMAEFLAEGIEEGTHIVKIDFEGTLTGLPSGDTPVKGTTSGVVIVRFPGFSITFSHPSVVRAGEEYDIYVTMTNTSPVDANLVSLTMPTSRLIGTRLLGDETVFYEVIVSGEAETAKFRMLSLETGRVRATAFEADGNVTGKFVLTAGVGEEGIPLSPDTLVLPSYAYLLPNEVINDAVIAIGEAYNIATTPPGGLPEHLPYINNEVIETRIIELSEAGQRVGYGDSILKSVQVLSLDWIGNLYKDISFDILRRLTSKGVKFASTQADIFNEELKSSTPVDFQKSFAETCSYKNPFLSAIISSGGSERIARLNVTDYYQNQLTLAGEELIRDIPYGELFLLEEGNYNPVDFALVGHMDKNGYTVEVIGEESGSFDLSLIVPGQGEGFRQVVFSGINCETGSRSFITIKGGDENFILSIDLDGDGTAETSHPGDVQPIVEPPLQLISATQDCKVDEEGHAAALFFNKMVSAETASQIENFYVEGKEIYATFLQSSGRVVFVGLNNPISPFVESRIRVENLKDSKGGEMSPSPVEMPIMATIKTRGGVVYGKVLTAEGEQVTNAKVILKEFEDNKKTYSYTRTDDSGNYQFDFVRVLSFPFEIIVQDVDTGKVEKIVSKIRVHGERLEINIYMRGRGIVRGKAQRIDGTPVPRTIIYATAENAAPGDYFRTYCNQDGEFVISGVPIGRINLAANSGDAGGYASTAISYAGETSEVTITLLETKYGIVSGRVLKSDGVTPVYGSTVYIYRNGIPLSGWGYETPWGVNTDSEGYFQYDEITVGSFEVNAINPETGHSGPTVTGEVMADQTSYVAIIFRGKGIVSGKVLSHDGVPSEGVLVYIKGTYLYMNTDSSGEFLFENAPLGTRNITAYDNSTGKIVSEYVTIDIEGQEARAILVFPEYMEKPVPMGGIYGKVYEPDGSPSPAGTELWVSDNRKVVVATANTDSNGNFQVENLPVGNYLLLVYRADAAGVASATINNSGHFPNTDLRLKGTGKIRVNVFTSDGQTGIMADVTLSYQIFAYRPRSYIGFQNQTSYYTTNGNGYLEVSNVYTGSFFASAKNVFYPLGASKKGTLNSPGDVATVDLVMAPTGKVKVKVVSYDGITIVPNASLKFRTATLPLQEGIYTDENGEFLFTLVPPGNFSVEGTDQINGFVGSVGGYMGTTGDTVVVILRLKGKGQVKVTVKNLSGDVIPGSNVSLRTTGFPNQNIKDKTCDENGTYTFQQIFEGNFVIEVFDNATSLGGRASGKVKSHNEEVEVDVFLEPSGSVTGRVLESDNETIVSGVQVVLYFTTSDTPFGYITTGSDGTFKFDHVPRVSYRVDAFDPPTGRKGRSYGSIEYEGEEVETDIYLKGRGKVSGTFYDGSKVNPIPNAQVKIKSSGLSLDLVTTTGSEGNFSFDQISEGSFKLEGRETISALLGKATGEIEYDGQSVFIDIYVRPSGTVVGTIFRNDGITPVPNAFIELTGVGEKSTYSDENGKYSIEYVCMGDFSVTAEENPGRDKGMASGILEFHGQEVTTNVIFDGLGTVSGVVKDGGGNPVLDINVKLTSNYKSLSTISNTSGQFSFEFVWLGPFRIEAENPVTGLSASGGGTLETGGQVISKDLTLESAGSVSGKVFSVDADTPVENAYIKLKGSNFTLHNYTDAEGNFKFNTVRLGIFIIDVQGADNSGLARCSGQIASHGDNVNFDNIILDNQRPSVMEIFPANGSFGIPLDIAVTLQFSEPMKPATINTTNIRLLANGTPVPGSLVPAVDYKSVIFTPSSSLSSFILYTITTNLSLQDAAGNPLETAVSSTFTSTDIVPPQVKTISPSNNASEISTTSVITVTFSESIDTSTFAAQNITLSKISSPVPGTIEFAENKMTVIFTPAQPMDTDSTYNVFVQGAVDIAGNIQTQPFTSSFSTIDTISPTLQLVPPAGGTSVIEGSSVTVTTTSGTDISSVNFFINGELKYTDKSKPYTFQFMAPLLSQAGGPTFLVEAYAIDHAGNQSTRENLQFTLISDSPPQAAVTGPANTDVYPGQSVTVSVTASDDLALKSVILYAKGGKLDHTDTRITTMTQFSEDFNFSIPSDILPGTVITITAEAVDSRDNHATSPSITLQVPDDKQEPQVTLTSPADGQSFKHKDIIRITATADDDVGLKEVNLYLDDQLLESTGIPPYETTYTVPPLEEEKIVIIKAEAVDLSEKVSQSSVNVILEKLFDETAPVVKILSPTNGSLAHPNENLTFEVEATDDEGVDRVEFYVDDQLINTGTEEPYETIYTIPADATSGTIITFKVIAVDVDNKSTSDQAEVEVVTGTVLTDGTIIDDDNTDYENQTIIINDGTVTINGAHTFTNVLVKGNGVLTHSAATIYVDHKMELTITGKLVISIDARIEANSIGYLGASSGDNTGGTGRTLGNTTDGGSQESSGASYGGYGGKDTSSSYNYNVNNIYGSIHNPTDPGSGGGSGYMGQGGNGGGVIRLNASEIILDGMISSNGQGSSWGAGSGGSIRIDTTTLKGPGYVQANGGNSSGSGAGGGGRIALYYQNAEGFNLWNITAYGGTYTPGDRSYYNGSAGTVYQKKQGDTAQLIINNRGQESSIPIIFTVIEPSVITSLSVNVLGNSNARYMAGSLVGMKLIPDIDHPENTILIIANDSTTITVDGDLSGTASIGGTYGGIMVFDEHLMIINTHAEIARDVELGELTITSNSSLGHPGATTSYVTYLSITANKITIDSGSSIDVTARGYLGAGQGDNTGYYGRTLGNTTSGGSYYCSGGSYGGLGGKYQTYAVNKTYGSLYAPSEPGSGGACAHPSNPGGNGGGVVRIQANEIVLNGVIYANGMTALAGAGSAGSIRIDSGILKGSGQIRAHGGNGVNSAGGGGRIAVYYEDASEFDLAKITAYGGTFTSGINSERNGGAGTVFLKKSTATYGDLIVDNNNISSREDSTSLPAVRQGFNTTLEANRMENSTASFIPGALVGLKLNPLANGNSVFTIISNISTEIFTDPADGDMTEIGTTGSPYIGEHYIFNLTIKGSARVLTTDRIQVSGTLTIEPGCVLEAENYQ